VPIEFYTHDPEHLAMPKGGVGIFLIDASFSPSATTAIASRFRLEVEESSDGPRRCSRCARGLVFVDYNMPVSTGSLRSRKFGGSTEEWPS
jgi:hypothetical protein